MSVMSLTATLPSLLPGVVLGDAATPTGGGLGAFLPLLLVGVAFYFIAIRPQQRRAKAQRALVASIGVGDRIVTIGGIHGTVRSLDDDTLLLDVAPGTSITVVRSAVGRKVVDADTPADDES